MNSNNYFFHCFSHHNITSKHKNTLEFTKDPEVTLSGDCIIGVKADFDLKKIKELIKNKTKLGITIKIDNFIDKIQCEINPNFNSDHEIVIRKSNFTSERTLGIWADKSSAELNKEIIERLNNKDKIINVILEVLE